MPIILTEEKEEEKEKGKEGEGGEEGGLEDLRMHAQKRTYTHIHRDGEIE